MLFQHSQRVRRSVSAPSAHRAPPPFLDSNELACLHFSLLVSRQIARESSSCSYLVLANAAVRSTAERAAMARTSPRRHRQARSRGNEESPSDLPTQRCAYRHARGPPDSRAGTEYGPPDTSWRKAPSRRVEHRIDTSRSIRLRRPSNRGVCDYRPPAGFHMSGTQAEIRHAWKPSRNRGVEDTSTGQGRDPPWFRNGAVIHVIRAPALPFSALCPDDGYFRKSGTN